MGELESEFAEGGWSVGESDYLLGCVSFSNVCHDLLSQGFFWVLVRSQGAAAMAVSLCAASGFPFWGDLWITRVVCESRTCWYVGSFRGVPEAPALLCKVVR